MPKHIAVLTGPFGSGKTTVCRQLADLARQRVGLRRNRVPVHFNEVHQVSTDLLDLRTGECRPLAKADDQPSELRTTRYQFDAEVMAWGVVILDTACPCDVLIVDEIGLLSHAVSEIWIQP